MIFPYSIEKYYEYRRSPFVVASLCILASLIHLYIYVFLPEIQKEDIFYNFGFTPVDFKIWTPITCTLLHGGIMHLFGNLYFLWIYGEIVEKHIGHVKFIILYIVGAYISIFAHLVTVPDFYSDTPCIGASGAISAVLGAFFVLFPKAEIKAIVFSIFFFRPLPARAPAFIVLGLWFIIQIAYGLQLVGDFANIAFWAHIAGFATGAILGSIYLKQFRDMEKRETELHVSINRIIEIFENFKTGNIQTARELLIDFNPFSESRNNLSNWRVADAIFAIYMDDEKELALKRIISEYERIKSTANPAQIFQLYHLAVKISPESLSPEFHLNGAIAAFKLKIPTIANFALLRCAEKMLLDKKIHEKLSEQFLNVYRNYPKLSSWTHLP
jgi:membrane associated rhomboid family serine protease